MRNVTIGSVWGIPIRINVSLLVFLPILAWLIGSGSQMELYAGFIERFMGVPLDLPVLRAGATPWVIGVVAAVGLFVSVTLHELGHSWVALRYGLEIESITLWILGGIAALKTIPREWNREFWIAVAGPITSLLVGAAFYAGVLVVPRSFPVVTFVLGWLTIANATLAAFNMLPAFPMDGGRVFRAVLARNRPYADATVIAGRVGITFALVFAVAGVFAFNPILLLLALFVYGAATTESRAVLLDELLDGITVGDIMTRDPRTVSADATVAEFTDRVLRDGQTVYPVTDEAGETVGVVSLDDLGEVAREDHETTRIDAVMRETTRIPSTADAFDTLALLQQSSAFDALVEDGETISGVLSESNYTDAITMQRGFQSGVTG